VACQVGLYVGAATTNIVLDGVIATKNIGSAIVAKGIGVGYSVEQQVAAAIEAINLFAKV
jgi:hypothetical protein